MNQKYRRISTKEATDIADAWKFEINDELDSAIGSTEATIALVLSANHLQHFEKQANDALGKANTQGEAFRIMRDMVFMIDKGLIFDAAVAKQSFRTSAKLLLPEEIEELEYELFEIKKANSKKALSREQFIENMTFIIDVLSNYEGALQNADVRFSIHSSEPYDDGDAENGPNFHAGYHQMDIWVQGAQMGREDLRATICNRIYNHTLDAELMFEEDIIKPDLEHLMITWMG